MKKRVNLLIVCVSIFLSALAGQTSSAATITSISQNASTIGKYEKFEMTFTLSESYSNPFDTDVVDIMATVTLPDSNIVEVPAFYYLEYDENASGYYINERNPNKRIWQILEL